MTREHELHDDDSKWHRKILNGYWIVVLISFVGEIVALYFEIKLSPEYVNYYIVHTMLIPTGLQVAFVTANELLERYDRRPHPYMTISTGILIGAVLIYGNPYMIGMQYVMLLPMLIAAFHFRRRLLTFSYLMLFPVLAMIYILFPNTWTQMTVYERAGLVADFGRDYCPIRRRRIRGHLSREDVGPSPLFMRECPGIDRAARSPGDG